MTQDDYIHEAVSRLNSKNLLDLWLTHGILSLIDYFGQDQSVINPLAPYLNLQVISFFGDAILRSTANYESQDLFTSADAVPIMNALKQAEDAGAVEFLDVDNVENLKDVEFRLLRWLSVVSFSQFRFQTRDILQRIARSYALLDAIPNQYRERLRDKHGGHHIDIPAEFERRFGISVKNYYQCALRLLRRYKWVHDELGLSEQIKTILKPFSQDTPEGQQAYNDVLLSLIDQSKNVYNHLAFQSGSEMIQNFLNMASRDTQSLRDLHQNEPSTLGYYGHQLSPLEMYPIVEIQFVGGQGYVVPNFRHFSEAITHIPHFALMNEYPPPGNEYNEQLGTIQEIYLEDLVQTRIPSIVFIPERTYGKEQVRGPDLTLIDHEAQGLIVLESKAKRMRASSKVDPMSEALMADVKKSLPAIKKLKAKIDDLYRGLPVYQDFQDQIDATESKEPICVLVMGEGVFFFSHILDRLLDGEPHHFLHTFPHPYCLMSLETFESLKGVHFNWVKSVAQAAHFRACSSAKS